MKKALKILVMLMTVLTLLAGSISILRISATIVDTSWKLFILRDNAQFYNEQDRITDEMTQDYFDNHAERQKIYNSDDPVVRIFSNQHAVIKLLGCICAISSFLLIPYMWFIHIVQAIIKRKHKLSRRKASKQK